MNLVIPGPGAMVLYHPTGHDVLAGLVLAVESKGILIGEEQALDPSPAVVLHVYRSDATVPPSVNLKVFGQGSDYRRWRTPMPLRTGCVVRQRRARVSGPDAERPP